MCVQMHYLVKRCNRIQKCVLHDYLFVLWLNLCIEHYSFSHWWTWHLSILVKTITLHPPICRRITDVVYFLFPTDNCCCFSSRICFFHYTLVFFYYTLQTRNITRVIEKSKIAHLDYLFDQERISPHSVYSGTFTVSFTLV